MKHRKRDPGSGVSSSRSNVSRAMRGRIPKILDILPNRSQDNEEQTNMASELVLSAHSVPSSALQQMEPASLTVQGKRTSDRNRRSPSYYGFENSSSESAIEAPTK